MTSYVVDGLLMVALLATGLRMVAVRRELKRLRALHAEFRESSERLTEAVAVIQAALARLDPAGRGLARPSLLPAAPPAAMPPRPVHPRDKADAPERAAA